jgi:hypothetical protein
MLRVIAGLVFLIAISLLLPGLCLGDSVTSYTGTFTADNAEESFNVLVGASGAIVQAQTLSYAGGVNAAGNTIAAGGFAPALWLFDPTGLLIADDNLGGTVNPFPPPDTCYGRAIDSTTGFCEDAVIYDSSHAPLTLSTGDYTLVLTQQGDNLDGTSLSDGFTQDSNVAAGHSNDPTFTGDLAGYTTPTMFIDPGNSAIQRDGNWALDITVTDLPAAPVPEPSTAALILAGCVTIAGAWARKNFIRPNLRCRRRNF